MIRIFDSVKDYCNLLKFLIFTFIILTAVMGCGTKKESPVDLYKDAEALQKQAEDFCEKNYFDNALAKYHEAIEKAKESAKSDWNLPNFLIEKCEEGIALVEKKAGAQGLVFYEGRYIAVEEKGRILKEKKEREERQHQVSDTRERGVLSGQDSGMADAKNILRSISEEADVKNLPQVSSEAIKRSAVEFSHREYPDDAELADAFQGGFYKGYVDAYGERLKRYVDVYNHACVVGVGAGAKSIEKGFYPTREEVIQGAREQSYEEYPNAADEDLREAYQHGLCFGFFTYMTDHLGK